MTKKTIVAGAAVLPTAAGAGLAQPPGIKNCGLCTNSNWDVKSKGIKN